ncbi:MAG: ribose-phosphate pyrophosphokinase, partial [Mesorhizobium sp.]
MKLFAGNSNRVLAEAVARYLNVPLGKASVRRFADQEIFVEIQENVRGEDVFILQSTSYPTNDHLMELLIMMDAFMRSSARRITAVIPYFGYARQDRRASGRTPISAKLVANMITRAGADRVLTLDLHAGQIQGFFDIPTDNLFSVPVMARDVKAKYKQLGNVVVVSPDIGGVVRARALAKRFDAQLAIVATSVTAYITHGVLSGGAVARIAGSKLQELVITDSIQPTQGVLDAPNIRVISIADLMGEAISRTATE